MKKLFGHKQKSGNPNGTPQPLHNSSQAPPYYQPPLIRHRPVVNASSIQSQANVTSTERQHPPPLDRFQMARAVAMSSLHGPEPPPVTFIDHMSGDRPPQDRVQLAQDGKEDVNPAELERMIGYLTATASEDWELTMKVCECATASESNARVAVRALRRELKYGEPATQLSATKLWAIMLRNSSDVFVLQSTSRKFLETLENILLSPNTVAVVRERLLDVVAAAAYASGTKDDGQHAEKGFKGLWKRVKPSDRPDEASQNGVPFDTDDARFIPPASGRLATHETLVTMDNVQDINPDPMGAVPPPENVIKKGKSPRSNRIIPPDEDMRRLFHECKIGKGNASVLSESLVGKKPEELRKNPVIKEFYRKCRSSQELIHAQIAWATANADRSRRERELAPNDVPPQKHTDVLDQAMEDIMDFPVGLTIEEKLLAALLSTNGDLLDALKQYDDVLRVAREKKAANDPEPASSRLPTRKAPVATITKFQDVNSYPTDSVPPPNVIKEREYSNSSIVPTDEDMGRLFQECKTAQRNASVLSKSLEGIEPEELTNNDVAKGYYMKCRASQELIFAQIPWATANADRCRRERELGPKENAPPKKRNVDLYQHMQGIMVFPLELTIEENLLAALLSVNGDLLNGLKTYDDILRVEQERKAERARRDLLWS